LVGVVASEVGSSIGPAVILGAVLATVTWVVTESATTEYEIAPTTNRSTKAGSRSNSQLIRFIGTIIWEKAKQFNRKKPSSRNLASPLCTG